MKQRFWRNVHGMLWSLSLWITACPNGMAQQSQGKADTQPYSLGITTKFHSAGHSPYTGVYLNHHPNAEINLSYKYKQFGGFITRNTDFIDIHSNINFSTVGFFKSFQVSKSVKLTPYLGYFFKQSRSFMDSGSDAWACVVVKITISRRLAIENTSLVGSLLLNPTNASLANRLNTIISIGKFRVDAYVWYSYSFNGAPDFVSASLAVTSPDWVITKSVSMRMQVSMLQHTSGEKPNGAKHRGGLITLIIPIDFSRNKERINKPTH